MILVNQFERWHKLAALKTAKPLNLYPGFERFDRIAMILRQRLCIQAARNRVPNCGPRRLASTYPTRCKQKEFIMTTHREYRKANRAPQWSRVISALLVVFVLCAAGRAAADEITVAAAADLTFAFKDVGARFEKETGNTVKFSFGSSGNFLTQIQNGAPFDMFFSADISYPKKLEAAGLIEPGSLYQYATGEIVIWVPNASTLDLKQGLAVLTDSHINKIAIGNPEHAPYGRAAVAAMKHENVYDKVSGKLVMGENIAQAAQFVESGNADVGILALSLALSPNLKAKGRYVLIPATDYLPLEQAVVIIKSSQKKATAKQFLAFMKTPAIVSLMHDYGFTVPESTATAN
jgi:molybdate transport system substrate-binding protein